MGTLVTAMDHCGMDVSNLGHHHGQCVVVLRAGMGRVVVLGSSGERFFHAVVGGDCPDSFPCGDRETRQFQELDRADGYFCLFSKFTRNLFGSLRSIDLCTFLRQ